MLLSDAQGCPAQVQLQSCLGEGDGIHQGPGRGPLLPREPLCSLPPSFLSTFLPLMAIIPSPHPLSFLSLQRCWNLPSVALRTGHVLLPSSHSQ